MLRLNRQQWAIIALVVLELVMPRFRPAHPHPPMPFKDFAVFAIILVGVLWFLRPAEPTSKRRFPRWLRMLMIAYLAGVAGYALLSGMQTGTMPVLPAWVHWTNKASLAVGLVAAFIHAGRNPEDAGREHRLVLRGSVAIVIGLMGAALGLRALRAFGIYGPQSAQPWTTAAVSVAVIALAFRIRGTQDAALHTKLVAYRGSRVDDAP